MIKTFVEFRNPVWKPTVAEMEAGINEVTAWGKYVADFLVTHLKALGFDIINSYQEDWGYEIAVSFSHVILYIGCGHNEEYQDGFLVMINPTEPYIRKWFKKIDIHTYQIELTQAIDKTLKQNQDIYDIKWWTEKEFNNPQNHK